MTCERYTSLTFAEDRHHLRQLNDSPVSRIKVDKPFPSIKNNWLGVTGKPDIKVSLVFPDEESSHTLNFLFGPVIPIFLNLRQ
jgi:hypothetical protein